MSVLTIMNECSSSYLHPSQLLLLIYLIISTSSVTTLNKYETDNDTYWMSTSLFTPIRGARYGGVKRRKSMYFSLNFQYYGKTTWDNWENILRIGNYGNANSYDCDPSLFILPSKNGLQISLSNKGDCWFVIEKNYNLIQNVIYNLIIEYNQTYSTISTSTYNATTGQIIEPLHFISNTSRTNDNTSLGKFMDVIISDPLSVPANVLLSDIVIISYDETFSFPTESPNNDYFDLLIIIVMNYNSNNMSESDSVKVITAITEHILDR
eukprot:209739_1